MVKTCAIIARQNIPAEEKESLKQRLSAEISRAVDNGYTRFLSGYISTVELCFAEVVTEIKKENPGIELENTEGQRNRFKYAIEQAELIIAVYDRRDKGNTEALLSQVMTLERDIYIIFHR
jgi:uncharacterized phage-like protein YoqJ